VSIELVPKPIAAVVVVVINALRFILINLVVMGGFVIAIPTHGPASVAKTANSISDQLNFDECSIVIYVSVELK
jgi:hypothetical protein